MMETVLVTQPEFAKTEAVFCVAADVQCVATAPDEVALAAAVATHSARAVIVGVTPYGGLLYESLG